MQFLEVSYIVIKYFLYICVLKTKKIKKKLKKNEQ